MFGSASGLQYGTARTSTLAIITPPPPRTQTHPPPPRRLRRTIITAEVGAVLRAASRERAQYSSRRFECDSDQQRAERLREAMHKRVTVKSRESIMIREGDYEGRKGGRRACE